MTSRRKLFLPAAAAAALTLAVAGCGGSDDPFEAEDGGDDGGDSAAEGPVVIGSQAYYSNEIIAEIYAQVLEEADIEVERQFQIGQRDAYLQAMENGEVQLLPEYTGNLLQFYEEDTEARSPEEVAADLPDAMPEDLDVLDYAEAQDTDSYNVTADFAEDNDVTSLADLAGIDEEITVGGNAELESRPYGPEGLAEVYDVEVSFVGIGDSGGPLTKDAIRDGTITMGNIYTADPDLAGGDFVTLEDPESMILAQNVVPVVAADLADDLRDILAPVSEALSTEELIDLNARSQEEQLDSATIAGDWLDEQGLVG